MDGPPLGCTPEDQEKLRHALDRRGVLRFRDPGGAARAWLAWTLHRLSGRMVMVVADGPHSLDVLFEDLSTVSDSEAHRLACFPASEGGGESVRAKNPDLAGDRLDTLRRCRSPEPPALIATCISALLQPTLPPDRLDAAHFSLNTGQTLAPAALAEWADANGYALVPEVQAKGECARRGGILDIWPPHLSWPVRAEFFGDTVESLRSFDPWQQRSREAVKAVELTAARETPRDQASAFLTDHLPGDTIRIWLDPEDLDRRAALCAKAEREAEEESIQGCDAQEALPSKGWMEPFAALRIRAAARGGTDAEWFPIGAAESEGEGLIEMAVHAVESLPAPSADRRFEPDALSELRISFVRRVCAAAAQDHPLWFAFTTEGARDRFRELYFPGDIPSGVVLKIGGCTEGFIAGPDPARPLWTVVSEGDLYGRRSQPLRYDLHARRSQAARAPEGERITDAGALQPGDWVVHVDHGIGRYAGMNEIVVGGVKQEVLTVEYADKVKLHIPAGQAHVLSRYIGVGRATPTLHRLGSARWAREKEAAQRAVRDLAAQLLETQAARETRKGHAFNPDTPWQHELETAFPHVETPDQHQAIQDVKRDMERPQPMDRLICGDVGFGKTEVALRAAFKAVMDGKQVAVLVPTTVLAQQHFETFSERMAAFPVAIELLSRYRTRAEQMDTLSRLRDGRADIVIGTHRLVQRDVEFHDLGLVVIDEEQRFGVEHKEAFKRLRSVVDVLTMTATPIPRTLYLSLTGARHLSVIQTPPQERLPVKTIVCPFDENVVREAILRELNREGQVFYLHNRVETIGVVRDRLRHLVPEARIEVAHGQMGEGELEDMMHRFVAGEFDVLLCTTIIESGIDIPRVNTILIERADRFGLSDLYQLRGRVGRYRRQAFAYLMLPRHGRLFDTARQRIGALQKHTGLGSGFKVALRDLETRGAGNLLGAEQSGHIAAVGFDLYCQLLRRTVAAFKGEASPPRSAEVSVSLSFVSLSSEASLENGVMLPPDYIEDETIRLQIYRRVAGVGTEAEVDALSEELRDRFGRRPPPVDRLLWLARVRLVARDAGVTAIRSDDEKIQIWKGPELVMPGGRHVRWKTQKPTARLKELCGLLREMKEAPSLPLRMAPAVGPLPPVESESERLQKKWSWDEENERSPE